MCVWADFGFEWFRYKGAQCLGGRTGPQTLFQSANMRARVVQELLTQDDMETNSLVFQCQLKFGSRVFQEARSSWTFLCPFPRA